MLGAQYLFPCSPYCSTVESSDPNIAKINFADTLSSSGIRESSFSNFTLDFDLRLLHKSSAPMPFTGRKNGG